MSFPAAHAAANSAAMKLTAAKTALDDAYESARAVAATAGANAWAWHAVADACATAAAGCDTEDIDDALNALNAGDTAGATVANSTST